MELRWLPPTARKLARALRAQVVLRSALELPWTARIEGRPVVSNRGRLVIGDRVRLISTVARVELSIAPGAELVVGERTFINYGTSISALESIRIGPGCNIGTYCQIMDNDFHRLEPERRLERPPSQPVELGANVWLGARVIVLPGVTIGDHSVVAAGSVVKHDVPSRSLVGGVPARLIRSI